MLDVLARFVGWFFDLLLVVIAFMALVGLVGFLVGLWLTYPRHRP